MAGKRDFVGEIRAKRARGDWYPVSAPWRLSTLRRVFDSTEKLDEEFLRYFPIALIAITESFFREAVKALLDHGSPYFENLAASPFGKEVRLDLSLAQALTGEAITLGDLFSHQVPLKSLEGIGALMDAAIGKSFFAEVAAVTSRWDVEVLGKDPHPIVADRAKTMEAITRAFQFRHIYAHELADKHPISREDVASFLSSGSHFLDASAEVVGDLLHPGSPLTQGAMNADAHRRFREARQELQALEEQIVATTYEGHRGAYVVAQEAFQSYRDAVATFESLAADGGSMQPMLHSLALEALTRERIRYLERTRRRPEDA